MYMIRGYGLVGSQNTARIVFLLWIWCIIFLLDFYFCAICFVFTWFWFVFCRCYLKSVTLFSVASWLKSCRKWLRYVLSENMCNTFFSYIMQCLFNLNCSVYQIQFSFFKDLFLKLWLLNFDVLDQSSASLWWPVVAWPWSIQRSRYNPQIIMFNLQKQSTFLSKTIFFICHCPCLTGLLVLCSITSLFSLVCRTVSW